MNKPKKAYLTDGRTWVSVWDGEKWVPDKLRKLGRAPLIWRSERVAEFYLEEEEVQLWKC